jgi:hypothetical protein
MIAARRWQQVAGLEPLNPYQRIRIVPAYGTSEGAHGAFFWNPASMEGIDQLAGVTDVLGNWKLWAAVGGAAGALLGGRYFWKRRR